MPGCSQKFDFSAEKIIVTANILKIDYDVLHFECYL